MFIIAFAFMHFVFLYLYFFCKGVKVIYVRVHVHLSRFSHAGNYLLYTEFVNKNRRISVRLVSVEVKSIKL